MSLPTLFGIFVSLCICLQNLAFAKTCIKAPPAEGRSCDLNGYHKGDKYYRIEGPQTFRSAKVDSIEDCAYLCARRAVSNENLQALYDDYCGSFGFDSDLSLCQLFDAPTSRYFLSEPPKQNSTAKPKTYNDVDCYDCGDQFCATRSGQPYGRQLLDNAGFEDPLLGPWGAMDVNMIQKRSNTYITMSDRATFSQAFNMCPGEWYEVSFNFRYNYKKKDPTVDFYTPSATFRADTYERDDGELAWSWGVGFDPDADTKGTWRRGRFLLYKYPEQEGHLVKGLHFATNVVGQPHRHVLAFDKFTATRRSSEFNPVAGAVSPLVNGGFESGSAAPWHFDQVETYYLRHLNANKNITSPGLNGSQYGIKILWIGPYDRYFLSQDNIPTKPNTMYLMSADFANGQVSGGELYGTQVDYIVIDNGVALKNTFSDFGGEFNRIQNQTLSWPFYVTGNNTKIVISMSRSEYNTTLTVDNVRLEELAE